jgi:HlyD family secretion protein
MSEAPPTGPSPTPTPSQRRRRITWIVLATLAALVVLGAAFRMRGGDRVHYFTAKVAKGDIRDVVDATGTINAVTTVQVGSQVSGQIAKLFVDFNSRVHKGEIVARIDPALFQAALDQATADLESAKANVMSAQADLEKARALAVQTKSDYERNIPLAEKDYVTQQTLTDTKGTYDVNKAAVDGAAAAVDQTKAQVKLKAAAVAVAQTNLDYTVIRSPIDGTVVARNVDVGQTVAASLQAPTIFTIAQDLTKMQLYAAADESDVGRIKLGQAVTFKVDAFPRETFRGIVSQIRMNATTVQNVVTYNAIIDFANPELKLFPGMTAYVTIPVATVKDVMKVPNTALRYHPPLPLDEIHRRYAQMGIDLGSAESPSQRVSDTAEAAGTQAAGQSDARHTLPLENVVVWKHLGDGSIEPVELAVGITDHAFTEVAGVIKGALRSGDEVITGGVAPGGAKH